MGWLIGGAMLVCCIGIPLLIRFVRKRRAHAMTESKADKPP
ncbi:hypothetical protein [Sulfuricystis multivorans]|nr:hypothetical protein [Sulfuricystis multivorans]